LSIMSQVALVWIHLLAAVSWIGGTVFLSLVLAPSYRAMASKPDAGALFRTSAKRFRLVVWGAAAVLLLTGPMLAFSHGWPLFEPAQWPSPLRVKLALVAALLLLTLAHDLVLGPRVRAILVHAPNQRTASDRMVLAAATWLPRMALLLSLAVLFAAVSLVRS
jgi:putative copper resistance protein D